MATVSTKPPTKPTKPTNPFVHEIWRTLRAGLAQPCPRGRGGRVFLAVAPHAYEMRCTCCAWSSGWFEVDDGCISIVSPDDVERRGLSRH
jgi:hypothetical protein